MSELIEQIKRDLDRCSADVCENCDLLRDVLDELEQTRAMLAGSRDVNARLTAENERLHRQVKVYKDSQHIMSQDNFDMQNELESLAAENELLREIKQEAMFMAMHVVPEHIPGLVQRGHFERFRNMMLSDTAQESEEHPDHCLCDECVTLDNMDERLDRSREFADK